jgi:hypothetical protein
MEGRLVMRDFVGLMRKKMAKVSPLPWSPDNVDLGDEGVYFVMQDGDLKHRGNLFDTASSDVALIETEYDEDGASRYDSVGLQNFEAIALMMNEAPAVIELLVKTLQSQAAYIAMWEKDRAYKLVPTEGSLAAAKQEIASALEFVGAK